MRMGSRERSNPDGDEHRLMALTAELLPPDLRDGIRVRVPVLDGGFSTQWKITGVA